MKSKNDILRKKKEALPQRETWLLNYILHGV